MKQKSKRTAPRKLSPADLAKREGIFGLYRDLGPTRSYERLIELIRPKYGDVSKRTLVNWSGQHNWQPRVAEYDETLATGTEAQAELDPNFDRTDALLRSSHLALQRALASRPTVRTPQDYKALVDAAEKAIMLVEKLRALGADRGQPDDVDKRANLAAIMLNELRQAVKDKFAAMGTPVQRLVLDEHGQKVIDVTPSDSEGGGAAP